MSGEQGWRGYKVEFMNYGRTHQVLPLCVHWIGCTGSVVAAFVWVICFHQFVHLEMRGVLSQHLLGCQAIYVHILSRKGRSHLSPFSQSADLVRYRHSDNQCFSGAEFGSHSLSQQPPMQSSRGDTHALSSFCDESDMSWSGHVNLMQKRDRPKN
jgi:hypothetical protein